jgi:tRNA (mo5U34)-methyltransferase
VLSAEEIRAGVQSLLWFHSIDLGHGIVTPGFAEPPVPTDKLPAFAGKSVLDIGAWDGYYSYLAEREGASRVVALDHYAWGCDFIARGAYWQQFFEDGTLPDHSRDLTDFWNPELLGRRGFNFAHQALESKVEPVLGDIMTIDLSELGQFDVVVCLGVLYHMKEPLTMLERVHSLTREVAVIETEAMHFKGFDNEALLEFHAGGDLHADFGNWFVPSIGALHDMCRAAGFKRVETAIGPPQLMAPTKLSLASKINHRLRGVPLPGLTSANTGRYRAVVHAYV